MPDKDIYGQVPDLKGDAKSALSDAMSDLAESNSNTINGSLKSKDSEYDPENGK